MKTYTVREVAEKFNVAKRVVQGWCERGILPNATKKPSGMGFDVWEIPKSDIKDFVPPDRPGRPEKRTIYGTIYDRSWNVPIMKLNELVEALGLDDDLHVLRRADEEGNDIVNVCPKFVEHPIVTFDGKDKQKAYQDVSNFLNGMAVGLEWYGFKQRKNKARSPFTTLNNRENDNFRRLHSIASKFNSINRMYFMTNPAEINNLLWEKLNSLDLLFNAAQEIQTRFGKDFQPELAYTPDTSGKYYFSLNIRCRKDTEDLITFESFKDDWWKHRVQEDESIYLFCISPPK